jgi:hypothetical protein
VSFDAITEDNILKVIGEDITARDPSGELRSRIATIFPHAQVIVTLPGIHAGQRLAFIDWLNTARAAQGRPPLSEAEECAEMEQSVDLFVEEHGAFIRPDPARMASGSHAQAADQVSLFDGSPCSRCAETAGRMLANVSAAHRSEGDQPDHR